MNSSALENPCSDLQRARRRGPLLSLVIGSSSLIIVFFILMNDGANFSIGANRHEGIAIRLVLDGTNKMCAKGQRIRAGLCRL